jgi:nicotinamide mononucleotide (NMN) deamidase PncC
VVAYASIVKHSLLGVPAGPVVSEQAAAAMAAGAGRVLKAAVGLAVTGVGGPGPQECKAPGTVSPEVTGPLGPPRVPGAPVTQRSR